jgi:hypothetical protein
MRSLLIIPAIGLLLGGCASKESYEAYRQSFDRAAEAYYLTASEPLVDIQLPSPVKGEFYSIRVNREIEPLSPQQIKNSEWAPVISKGLGVVGTIGAAYVISNAVVDLADSVGDAAGVHAYGDNARLSGVGNRAVAGNHGSASAGDHHETSLNVHGTAGTSGSLDQSKPSTVTSDDDVTTTVTRTNTEIEN